MSTTHEQADAEKALTIMRHIAIDCDSELSAQAHGRPPSSKEHLLGLSRSCRNVYEGAFTLLDRVHAALSPRPAAGESEAEKAAIMLEALDGHSAAEFLRRLAQSHEGRCIVSTASLEPMLIEIARKTNHLLVLNDGLGFVLGPVPAAQPKAPSPSGGHLAIAAECAAKAIEKALHDLPHGTSYAGMADIRYDLRETAVMLREAIRQPDSGPTPGKAGA